MIGGMFGLFWQSANNGQVVLDELLSQRDTGEVVHGDVTTYERRIPTFLLCVIKNNSSSSSSPPPCILSANMWTPNPAFLSPCAPLTHTAAQPFCPPHVWHTTVWGLRCDAVCQSLLGRALFSLSETFPGWPDRALLTPHLLFCCVVGATQVKQRLNPDGR